MPYSDKDYKVSNVNYLNKDFSAFKNTLIEYAKTYFPNTYRDFNETSPGMMLIEMSAYVGDVLSFYIDQQYQEMMLPLAEERRNVINLANMLGYKVKPSIPSYVDITVTQTVDAVDDPVMGVNKKVPNYAQALIIDKGMKLTSTSDSSVIFETLDVVDYTISGSVDLVDAGDGKGVSKEDFDSNGVVSTFKLTRKVKAISGEKKTKTFTIQSPEKFLRLTLSETNVIDIIKVVDTNGNVWYETDFLGQDRVPIETYYKDDDNRTTAYNDGEGNVLEVPVPYSLQYQQTSKRFITELNDDNTISLVFGNGVLRSGQVQGSDFIQTKQVGITIPGEVGDFNTSVDPFAGGLQSTLGEAPANTNITVEYRIGGGISSNVPSGDITTINSATELDGTDYTARSLSVTNDNPARGGSNAETVEEIRRKAKSFFATQNRCVTQEDYEARVLNMPAKFGNIAKVFVQRSDISDTTITQEFSGDTITTALADLSAEISDVAADGTTMQNTIDMTIPTLTTLIEQGNTSDALFLLSGLNNELAALVVNSTTNSNDLNSIHTNLGNMVETMTTAATMGMGNVNVYVLSYDENKNLVTTPNTDNIAHPLKINLKNYLSNYRIITDEIAIVDGKTINFGVVFDIVAHKSANKADVKLRCINKIKEYFNIDKMQFHQPIYTGDLEYELMGLEGVRSVNSVQLTQDFETDVEEITGTILLWDYDNENTTGVGAIDNHSGNNTYGWKYDFTQFYGSSAIAAEGVVLPSVTPSVFELKNPNENVKGIVR